MKNIIKKASLLFAFATTFAHSYCVPVICTPEGMAGQMQVISNISAADASIKEKYSKIKELNNKETELLKIILEKQKEFISLKSSKEVYFQKIIDTSNTLSLLLRSQQ